MSDFDLAYEAWKLNGDSTLLALSFASLDELASCASARLNRPAWEDDAELRRFHQALCSAQWNGAI